MRLLAQARLPVRGTAALLLLCSAALLLTRSTPALAFTAAPRALSVLSLPRRAGRLLSQARMASTGAAAAGGPSVSSTTQRLRTLETLNFDNLAIRSLPVDPETGNFIRQVRNAVYSKVSPTPVKNPMVVAVAEEAMDLLDLPASELGRPELGEVFAGNRLLPGSTTYSHCYCGHQFGAFSGQLGDGAAISLGEVLNRRGERWELQLKGAGPTPYSRRADGRKVLRSSVREFLCSEAMHHLGVPTTRAGTVITSDSYTERDPLYNGNVINERCTVVLRLAPTFIRFGSFEIFKHQDAMTGRAGSSAGNYALQKELLDFVVSTYFPAAAALEDEEGRYLAFFREVVERTARLVARWQLVGWTHGVLNTDNMSVLGLTIDYGPYGFVEHFDPDFIPNGSDGGGRYTYAKQPEICRWNCLKFAEALHPTLPQELAKGVVEEVYDQAFEGEYMKGMRAKLGLVEAKPGDEDLVKELFGVMEATGADFTDTFTALGAFDGSNTDNALERLVSVCAPPSTLVSLLRKKMRIARPSMQPAQVQALLTIAENEPDKLREIFYGPIEAVVEELRGELAKAQRATAISDGMTRYLTMSEEEKRAQDAARWRPFLDAYANRIRGQGAGREELMRGANPTFVLRNWIAQDAIEAAEKKDFSRVRLVLELLKRPFAEAGQACDLKKRTPEEEEVIKRYRTGAPDWAADLICTCSS